MGILNNELKLPKIGIESNLNPPNRVSNFSNPAIVKRQVVPQEQRGDRQASVRRNDPYHNFRRKLRKDIF